MSRVENLSRSFLKDYLDIIICVVLFALSVLIFQTNKVADEYGFLNAWVKNTNGEEANADTKIKINSDFNLQNIAVNEKFLLYFDKNGKTKLFYTLNNQDMVQAGISNFVLYRMTGVSTIDRSIRYFNLEGEMWRRETGSGYPEISPTGLLSLHSSENMSFYLIDQNNNIISEKTSGGDYITDSSFSTLTGDYAAGFINGYVVYVDRTGKTRFRTPALASKINVIKSVCLSEKGSFMAVVSGLHPEFLSVYDDMGKLIWYKETYLARRSHVSLYLSEEENTLIHLRDKSLSFRSLSDGKVLNRFVLEGYDFEYASYMKADIKGENLVISLSKEGESIILALNSSLQIVWTHRLKDWVYNIGLSENENAFVVTTANRIYCYKRTKL